MTRILIGSAGRRVYLVEWFRQALSRCEVIGEVHITDHDPMAATTAFADASHVVPRYADPDYPRAMADLVDRIAPDLYFSLNDHELFAMAGPLADRLRRTGCRVLSLSVESQRVVTDKYAMASALAGCGVLTPPTVLAGDSEGLRRMAALSRSLIVKRRFGSGSVGLHRVDAAQADLVVSGLARHGSPGGLGMDRPTGDHRVPLRAGHRHRPAWGSASGRRARPGEGGHALGRGERGDHSRSCAFPRPG